jgi:hypothetical protein
VKTLLLLLLAAVLVAGHAAKTEKVRRWQEHTACAWASNYDVSTGHPPRVCR